MVTEPVNDLCYMPGHLEAAFERQRAEMRSRMADFQRRMADMRDRMTAFESGMAERWSQASNFGMHSRQHVPFTSRGSCVIFIQIAVIILVLNRFRRVKRAFTERFRWRRRRKSRPESAQSKLLNLTNAFQRLKTTVTRKFRRKSSCTLDSYLYNDERAA